MLHWSIKDFGEVLAGREAIVIVWALSLLSPRVCVLCSVCYVKSVYLQDWEADHSLVMINSLYY